MSAKPNIICGIAVALLITMPKTGVCADALQRKTKPDRIVATDYQSLNDAIDAARTLGVTDVFIPAGKYTINKTLNLTSGPSETPRTFRIEGAGSSTVLIADTGNTPAIDLTGSSRVILRDFLVQTPLDEKNAWKQGASVGILMARTAPETGGPNSSGHHSLQNVIIQGSYATAAAFSYCSEENTFDHCVFINDTGDAFIFTGLNKEGVTSPYQKLGFSSNVVANFYFPWFWSGKEGSVGLRISYASDVYLFGGFFASYGKSFAAIYLDGTGQCECINLLNVRTEGNSGHTIYAVGAVHNVMIEGGSWHATNAESIHCEDVPPNYEAPHRFLARPGSFGRASNWIITGLRLNRSFEADPAVKYDPTKPVPEGFTGLRFDSLQDSYIKNVMYYTRRQKPGQEHFTGDIVTDTPMLVVENYSRRNTLEAPSRDAIDLRGDAKGNNIIGLADDSDDKVPALWMSGSADEIKSFQKYYDSGTRRTYVDPDASGSTMNFGVKDVFDVKDPKKGDFAMHDGTGFEDGTPRLAMYDGKRWVFFKPDTTLGPSSK